MIVRLSHIFGNKIEKSSSVLPSWIRFQLKHVSKKYVSKSFSVTFTFDAI